MNYSKDEVISALRAHLLGTPVKLERVHCLTCPFKGEPNCTRKLLSACLVLLSNKEV